MSGFMIACLLAAAVAGFLVLLYNRLVALRQTRLNAFSDIDVQLKQRYDLVPRLVETVKGYAAHEKGVLETVTAARAAVGTAASGAGSERLQAEGALGGALARLMVVAENYPTLKADGNFQNLMNQLSGIEDKIAAARRFFNNATNEYNTGVQQFPANIIAGMFHFGTEPFFDVSSDEKAAINKAPEVKFG